MVEIQHFLEAEAALVPFLDDTGGERSLSAANIHRSLMALYERTGRTKKACAAAKVELGIILKRYCRPQGPGITIIPIAHNNVGYTLVSAYKASEAITHLNDAVATARA